MGAKLAVLVQNELNLNLDQVFAGSVELGLEITHIPLYHTKDTGKIIDAAKGFDYVVAGREPWTEEVFEACSGTLKGLARFGAGMDTVNIAAATERSIAVSNAPGANSKAVAEHTLGMMLDVMRRITYLDSGLRAGGIIAKMTHALEGTVAIIGFGNIGQELAYLLQVFPVKVVAYDPYPNMEIAEKLGVEMVDLDTAICTADVISLNLPAVKQMADFICKDTIDKMKDGVFLINTSRGAVIREEDLIDALKSGKVAGAGLDVFKSEVFDQSSPFKDLDNVVLTPHSAAVSTQAVRMVFEHCSKVIYGYMTGNYDKSLINPDFAKHKEALYQAKIG